MSVKTYSLVAVLEKNKIIREKSKTEILCIDCCGKNLYIGTDDSFIVHFLLEEKVGDNGKFYFHCDRQEHKSSLADSKKPVTQVKAVSALNRVLAITDGVLQLLNMFDLEPLPNSPKIKGVTCFALNENPVNDSPFGIEVCLALKKRCVQVIAIKEDRIMVNWELSVADTPMAVSMDGAVVCAAFTSEYKMWQVKTGYLQDLFPFDSEQMMPIITKISKEEVLLSAPGSLGMFANSSGVSQRPPLQWNRRLVGLAYAHPYVVALDDEFITVHSILDQQQKQTFAFHGGQCIGDYDGRMLVATRRDIYALCPIPFEKQVQELLSANRVTEALLLAKNTRKTGMSKEAFSKMFRRIQLQAGFVELGQGHVDEARELFVSGRLDLRELISLFPGLLPPASSFTRAVPPLHEIPDIGHITRGDEERARTYTDFLLDLLLERSADIADDAYRKDVHTALLKLCAQQRQEQLAPSVETFVDCDVTDTAEWLGRHGFHHARALLLKQHGRLPLALDVWKRLVDQELADIAFPGIEFVTDCLCHCADLDVVWKHSDWVMKKNEQSAVRLFTQRLPSLSQQPDTDAVVTYLSRFGSRPLTTYLEWLVNDRQIKLEKYHTHLALLYLEDVLIAKANSSDSVALTSARSKLQAFLQQSSLYLTSPLLAKVKDTDLFKEAAILHGKAGDHEIALRILVHRLQDIKGAEDFCHELSRDADPAYKRRIFHTLLEVYLDPKSPQPEVLMQSAIALLNSQFVDMDCSKVIRMLPGNWGVSVVRPFLTKAVVDSSQRCRQAKVVKALSRAENLQLLEDSLAAKRRSVLLLEDRQCAVCGNAFMEPSCARYPNGLVVHVKCVKQRAR